MMKFRNILLLLLLFSTAFSLMNLTAQPQVEAQGTTYIVYITVRDYFTNNPLVGLNLSGIIRFGTLTLSFDATINSSGASLIKVPETYVTALGRNPPYLTNIYIQAFDDTPQVPIMVNVILLDERKITGSFDPSYNVSSLSANIHCPIIRRINVVIYRIDVRLAPGIYVNISHFNPITGIKEPIKVSPALRVKNSETSYETGYILPVGYPVLLETKQWSGRVIVKDLNTTEIPLTKYLLEALLPPYIDEVEDEASWLTELGYTTAISEDDVQILNFLYNEAMEALEEKDYEGMSGAVSNFLEFVASIKGRLNSLKNMMLYASIAFLMLVFGFTSVIVLFFIEKREYMDLARIGFFFLVFATLVLMEPAVRVSTAYLLSVLGVNILELDYAAIIAASLILGALVYFFYLIVSIKTKPVSQSAVTMAIRYLKARKLRTIMVVFTLTLVVASTVATLGVSLETPFIEEKSEWKYGFEGGVIIFSGTPAKDFEIKWLTRNLNITEYSLIKTEKEIYPLSGLLGENLMLEVKVIGINPAFFARYMNFSSYIMGGYLVNGTSTILIPLSYSNILNLGETVNVGLLQPSPEGALTVVAIALTDVFLAGFYDEASVLPLFNVSGYSLLPLGEEFSYVLVPEDVLPGEYFDVRAMYFKAKLSNESIEFLKKFVAFRGARVVLSTGKTFYKPLIISIKGASSAIIMLIFSSVLVAVTMYAMTEDKKRDLVTIAVLGASPRDVAQQIILEGLIIGFISSFLGCFLSPVLAESLKIIVSATVLPFEGRASLTLDSMYLSLLIGVLSSIVGSYLPAVKMRQVSLMGREAKKVLSPEDLRLVGEEAIYTLPLRVSLFETNLLYRFIKEAIVSPKEVISEYMGEDGMFRFTLGILTPDNFPINVTLRTVKKGDEVLLELSIPAEFKEYLHLSETIRRIEEKILHYSEWKEDKVRLMYIRREKPEAPKTLEDLLQDAHSLYSEYEDIVEKSRRLERIKHTVSPRTYKMYRDRYEKKLSVLATRLRMVSLKLEPHYKELKAKLSDVVSRIEELDVAFKIGELSEEEYLRKVEPLRREYNDIKGKIDAIEKIKTVLKGRLI
ncbi:MAG: hypothetical protein DRJ47_04905 [Thermoprotei archaeon]|nr:MAG: hypothetical protein DRJ47_04905 [Thermoprotei archaeon]